LWFSAVSFEKKLAIWELIGLIPHLGNLMKESKHKGILAMQFCKRINGHDMITIFHAIQQYPTSAQSLE
jgi:hypothetical protein